MATDFSARADRAIRRGTLLARQFSCDLLVTHVVDDDQAQSLVEAERWEAQVLLEKLAASLRDFDGLRCESRLALGEPFEQIAIMARAEDADLIVIGPYRRDRLKNVFIGATAERIIRASPRPVLMANGLAAAPYERVLVATDFSAESRRAVETAKNLGLLETAQVSVAHAYAVARQSLRALTDQGPEDHPETLAAKAQLTAFAAALALDPADQIAEQITVSAAETLRGVAARMRAELVIIGTSQRSPLAQAWLSGVAQDLLRFADTDILVVPNAAT